MVYTIGLAMSKSKMKGFKELMKVEDALRLLLQSIKIPQIECRKVFVEESIGGVACEKVSSEAEIPPFDRSAVDGYAVISSDTLSASVTNPITLKVVGEVKAGVDPKDVPSIKHGEAVIIYTGAPLPPNSDAVVMAEDATYNGGYVDVVRQVGKYQNVSKRGEDFGIGKTIIDKGTMIKPWHIGALASAGIKEIKVQNPLKIAILSTGDEIVELKEYDGKKGIVDSTKLMLKALLRTDGVHVIDLGIVNDDIDLIADKIRFGLNIAHGVITTGGTSIGKYDLVVDAVGRVEGSKVLFNGVRMRPGKPTSGAIVFGKPVFMLSGFPVASLAGYVSFVRPSINYMRGLVEEPMPIVKGKITRRVANIAGVKTYFRVRIYRDGANTFIEPLAITASGVLSTLTEANGLLVINEDIEGYDEGDEVEVIAIGPIAGSLNA
ncbi:MAG: molybdopterin molybdotransferase MoeA [Caldisphaeraceae archaeon]|nr:molybdopterin molybdotransferase MoeA [Caldisphaeraceae archaeon]